MNLDNRNVYWTISWSPFNTPGECLSEKPVDYLEPWLYLKPIGSVTYSRHHEVKELELRKTAPVQKSVKGGTNLNNSG